MAYTTGVSGSVADLLSAVRAFAVSNAGFTDHGSGWTYTTYSTFQLSKNGVYYTFQYTASELNINTSTALGNSGAHTGLPGAAAAAFARPRPIQGPHVGYWLFNGGYAGTGPCVHVVVEVVNGVFIHFSFGELEKQGSYTGGQYVTGSHQHPSSVFAVDNTNNGLPWTGINGSSQYAGHVRVPTALGHGAFSYANQNTGQVITPGSWASNLTNTEYGLELADHCYNTFNNRAPLIPIEVYASDAPNPITRWIPLGNVAGVASANTRNLDPKQIVLSDWQVFPVFEKNGAGTTYVNGRYFGLAYKR